MKRAALTLLILLATIPTLATDTIPVTFKSQYSPTATAKGDCFACAVAMIVQHRWSYDITCNQVMTLMGGEDVYLATRFSDTIQGLRITVLTCGGICTSRRL